MDRQSGAFSLPKLGIGVALVLLGLVMPLLVNVDNLGVYSTLFMALERQDTVLVLYAAIRLVALNIRSFLLRRKRNEDERWY